VPDADLASAAPGFYGKLPTRGDFVRRRLSPQLTARLDAWLQQAMIASQRELGSEWLHAYLNCPIWRFALARGSLGVEPAAGLLMSSVDRVGRYFPLLIVARTPPELAPVLIAAACEPWFSAAEAVLLRALDPRLAFEDFDALVAALGALTPAAAASAGERRRPVEPPVFPPAHLGADQRPAPEYDPAQDGATLWWLPCGEDVRTSVLRYEGMPSPNQYAAMLRHHQSGRATPEGSSAGGCPPAENEK